MFFDLGNESIILVVVTDDIDLTTDESLTECDYKRDPALEESWV